MNKNQDYSVLYQKYRPTKFSEVIGQEQFVKMLMNAIKNKQIANAYIFSGTYGIGKTTLARIFAKAVNCLNSKNGDACNECKNCLNIINNQSLDIIEIDAASNNGVENVRNIIENANYLPSSLNYKIYIIDEAHMITTGGWNAFLKTLENKKENVIFIFATTEINKIPKTILSRCQIYNLNSLSINDLMQLLNNVSKKEKIKIAEDAKLVLCELANNSARDLLSLLEQLIQINKNITLKLIEETFLLSNKETLFDLLDLILNLKEKESLLIIKNLTMKGLSIYNLSNSLLDLSVELYSYILFQDKETIKPSNYLLFKDKDFSNKKNILKNLISLLQPLIMQLKNTNNQLLMFESSLIKFFNENTNLFLIKNDVDEETINNNKNIKSSRIKQDKEIIINNLQIIKEDKISNITNKEIIEEKPSLINPVKDSYLDSFVINESNTKNKIKSSNNDDDFIKEATKRIEALDESWLVQEIPDISLISETEDVTNKLINKKEEKKDNSLSVKKNIENNHSLENELLNLHISNEMFYSFATHDMNTLQNKELVKKYNYEISNLKENESNSFSFLKEGLKLITKIALVNNKFMIGLADNMFNVNKFNDFSNQQEFLKELFQILNKEFYIRAFTKSQIVQLSKNNSYKFDINQYNDFINNLHELVKDNNDDDIESWTNSMLFKEK